MALAQIYTAVAGHVITAARWNNEFGNIYTNGTDLAFPLTKAVSLAGWTLTLDEAGVTTLSSSANSGFAFASGSKAGVGGLNGNLASFAAFTFTDTNTAAGSPVALWTGISIRTPTLAAANVNVTTVDAATLYIEGQPTAGTNQTITNPWALWVGGNVHVEGQTDLGNDDTRTNTVATPLIVSALTSGAPAAGIGTGILFQAESTDESPSTVGQLDFAFADVGAGSEDSALTIWLRVAGAALTRAYAFVTTTAFRAIFTHANTADRIYTLPDRSFTFGVGDGFRGPSSTAAGSTIAHEGTVVISASQALSGLHFYTDFTLDAGDTLTIADGSGRLVICATGTITINGTIDGIGAGQGTANGPAAGVAGVNGHDGYAQPGGGGGAGDTGLDGGNGGNAVLQGCIKQLGGAGATAASGDGSNGTTVSGTSLSLSDPLSIMGGAGGGSGGSGSAGSGGSGGRGGASIVLMAPSVILGAASAINTSGAAGSGPVTSTTSAGGAGGGAGNIYVICQTYTDNGCTFTLTGGAGANSGGTGGDGGSGASGVGQVNIYAA